MSKESELSFHDVSRVIVDEVEDFLDKLNIILVEIEERDELAKCARFMAEHMQYRMSAYDSLLHQIKI